MATGAEIETGPIVEGRKDLALIVDMVTEGARVLDIGCGTGALLEMLQSARGADARGLEISQAGVNACVARGLSVIQGDADVDLEAYPAGAFDFVILSRTIQAIRRPRQVLEEMLRIGRRVVVSLPNFGHWRIRWQIAVHGRMPITHALDQPWYESDNIHLCTVEDFVRLCEEIGAKVERAVMIHTTPRGRRIAEDFTPRRGFANLLAEEAVFRLARD